jgi:hypothetical protein
MEGTVSTLPFAVGDFEAQTQFIKRNAAFLREFPELSKLYDKVFIRSLELPDETKRQQLMVLPDDHPEVVAFEDKAMADLVIFYLGRMATDDLGEILILSGNGRGFGAYKIVRGMYERIVTSMYMEKNPQPYRARRSSEALLW